MATTWYFAPAPVARRVQAFFAPVNRTSQTPVLFDPSEQGQFSLNAPPAPWISLGWIQDFARKAASKTTPLLTGIPAAPLEQVRETLEAQVSLQFLSWTKAHSLALATGFATHEPARASYCSAQSLRQMERRLSPAVTPQSGSTATSTSAWLQPMRQSFLPDQSLRWMWIIPARRALWVRRWQARMCGRC